MGEHIIETINKIRNLLRQLPPECDMLDYKVAPYDLSSNKDKCEFARDVCAFLNSTVHVNDDKYIIFGVEDKQHYLKGLQAETQMPDDAIFQSLIQGWIRPMPFVITGKMLHDGKEFGYIVIRKVNCEYTYEIAKQYFYIGTNDTIQGVAEGQAWMRVGSTKRIMSGTDRKRLESRVIDPRAKMLASSRIPNSVDSDRPLLLSAAFWGAWSEKCQGDKDVISKFVGESYDDWIQKVQAELNRGNSDLLHVDGEWKINNRAEIILANAHTVFDRHIETFKTCALGVLRESAAKYELSANERDMMLLGKQGNYSRVLVGGISEAIAIINYHRDSFRNCSLNKVEAICAQIVHDLLVNCNWKRLQTIGWNLTFLAQAAPDAFLDAIEENTPEIRALFQESENSILPMKYGDELLHTLQLIAWDKRYTARACSCLASLGVYDARAVNALVEILLPWSPQTTASCKTQIAIVKKLIEILGREGWQFVQRLLPGNTTSSLRIEKPKYMLAETPEVDILVSDYWRMSRAYLELGLQIQFKTKEWVSGVIELYDNVPPDMQELIVSSLTEFAHTDITEEEKYSCWCLLCAYLSRHEGRIGDEQSLSQDAIDDLRKLVAIFKPKSKVLQLARLFCENQWSLIELPENKQGEGEARLRERQCAGIKALWEDGRLSAMLSIVDISERTDLVGCCLASLDLGLDASDERHIIGLFEVEQTKASRFAISFARRRVEMDGAEWLQVQDIQSWGPSRRAAFYVVLPVTPDNWEWVEDQLGPGALLYWKQIPSWAIYTCPSHQHVYDMLVKSERLTDCLIYCQKCLAKNVGFPSTEQILVLLESVSQIEGVSDVSDTQFVISKLISWLQKSGADAERLVQLEWHFFNILGYGTTAKTLFYKMASDPVFFTDRLKILYKRSDDVIDQESLAVEKKSLALHCWAVMEKWRTMPGLQSDNSFDPMKMEMWVSEVKRLSKECSMFDAAMRRLGQAAYYVPPDKNGFFIDESVAKMLNAEDSKHQRDGYEIQAIGTRGVHIVDTTGETEFTLQRKWMEQAEEADGKGYFLFAEMLRHIAEHFYREGKENIFEERRHRSLENDE